MADGFNTDGPTDELDVFDCPKCGQTIDTKSDVCRFCGAKVDHEAARKAAQLLARIDQACSDASYLRNTAAVAFLLSLGALIVLLRSGGRLMLRLGFQNLLLGFCALVLIVSLPFPVWAVRWWTKNANLQSDDEDFQGSRTAVRSAGFGATGALLAAGLIVCWILVSKAAGQ
jgi:hypothetical protein